MAKSRFPLEMADGTKVRTLEELRANFDEEIIRGYFEDGMLTRWLEDRFYADEAEALRTIDKDSTDYPQTLWNALGIDSAMIGLDAESMARLEKKKEMLRDRTDDSVILSHAAQTAFDQEDLAELLERSETTIYLCGQEFRIPLQPNVTYVGILGTPKIIAKTDAIKNFKDMGIDFVNVEIPGSKGTTAASAGTSDSDKTWYVPKAQLKEIVAKKFGEELKEYGVEDTMATFLIVDEDTTTATTELTNEQKQLAISLICNNEYGEDDLVHLEISDDMASGWALTKDSFCVAHEDSAEIVPYESLPLTGWDSIRLNNRSVYLSELIGPGKDCLGEFLKKMCNIFKRRKGITEKMADKVKEQISFMRNRIEEKF